MNIPKVIAGILLILFALSMKTMVTEEYLKSIGLGYLYPIFPLIILGFIIVGIILAVWSS